LASELAMSGAHSGSASVADTMALSRTLTLPNSAATMSARSWELPRTRRLDG
jgi:hypothetical protein